jgi:hypothetical protein
MRAQGLQTKGKLVRRYGDVRAEGDCVGLGGFFFPLQRSSIDTRMGYLLCRRLDLKNHNIQQPNLFSTLQIPLPPIPSHRRDYIKRDLAHLLGGLHVLCTENSFHALP